MRRCAQFVCALGLSALAACSESTEPSSSVIDRHHAMWVARAPATYEYEYHFTGFFINGVNQLFRVEVRRDTVQAVIVLATEQLVAGPLGQFPTIEELFDRAAQALQGGYLTAIEFDPTFGYPIQMDIAGPPDAGGSVFASKLAALP